MKYYIYISVTKVDMLYDQIPARLRENLATELKIDLKVVTTTLSEQPSSKSLISKLVLVTNYLSKRERIGTIGQPAPYFNGKIDMRWGPLSRQSNAVVFAGEDPKLQNVVVLGGSWKHVIGETDLAKTGGVTSTQGFSGLPSIYYWLSNVDWQLPQVSFPDMDTALSVIANAEREIPGPAQAVEFLARKLLDGRAGRRYVILGSPIYVALADIEAPLEPESPKKRRWQFWKRSQR